MILFLRSKNNKTIVDMELTGKDQKDINISCVVDIDEYTKKFVELFTLDKDKAYKFSEEMSFVQEIRGWLFEYYLIETRNNFSYENLLTILRMYLRKIASIYDLITVED